MFEGSYLDVREHLAVKDLACTGALLRESGCAAKGKQDRNNYSAHWPIRIWHLDFLSHVVFLRPDSMKCPVSPQDKTEMLLKHSFGVLLV